MSDLRKSAQMALESLENDAMQRTFAGGIRITNAAIALRAALAQPEQDLQLVANLLKEYGLEALEVIAALKTQPEQTAMPPDIAKVLFDNVESLYVADDLPQLTKWTPMAEYAAKSAAVPGRAEALKQAGYTRRPRQLPKEDEPVAWRYDEATYRPGDLRGRQWRFNLFAVCKPYLHPIQEDMVQNVTPLYTAPFQRKPLTDDEIELAYREIWRDLSDGFSHTSVEWIEAGIRYAEKVHGIE